MLQYPSFDSKKLGFIKKIRDNGKDLSWSLKGMVGCSQSMEIMIT
jgi:hypothetical protein